MSDKPSTSEGLTTSAEKQIRLTEEIMVNLKEKVALFKARSAEERNKILIFTNDATLWGPYKDPSIRISPLPPIPQDYVPQPSYNIVREMSKFMREYCTEKRLKAGWCLSVRGSPKKPEVHVIMYDEILNPTDMIPIFLPEETVVGSHDPSLAQPRNARASKWRLHHQDSTLSDSTNSSIFSISLETPPNTPGGSAIPVPRVIIHSSSSEAESLPRDDEIFEYFTTDSEGDETASEGSGPYTKV